MEKSQLLARIMGSRAALEACLAQLDDNQWEQARVCGEWTPKDVLAHITWHENEMLELIRSRSLDGSPLWGLPTDERNAIIHAENQDRPLVEVLSQAVQVFRDLLIQVEGLSQQELDDPAQFANMPADWKPWQLISENSWEHYDDHTRELRAWLGPAGHGVSI